MADITGRFIEAHLLQVIPYANLNRDDNNSVKTVVFGDTPRTRVSSQSWKRAARLRLQQRLGQQALRTRRLAERVQKHLVEERGWGEAAAVLAGRHLISAGSTGADIPKKDADTAPWPTAAMVYLPDTAVVELADLAEQYRPQFEAAKPVKSAIAAKNLIVPGKEVDAILRSRNGVINLFGRMLAQVEDAKVDGAVQVAHAFTTHATDVEIDYFSAVDDVTADWDDAPGSAHLGHAEHSAGVLYRYAVVDLRELEHNLGGDRAASRELATAFLDAIIRSLPSAKKNSTAPNTVPDLIHLVVRNDQPVSYASAFERPVAAADEGGHLAASITALDNYATRLTAILGEEDVCHRGHIAVHEAATEPAGLGGATENLAALIAETVDAAAAEAAGEAR
ncbi:type I-E CRISPR-associated protein Cas7/Cse4/CasC [Streptomyces sp. SPB074]|uniref:type I-E CRISPR-associated protein Cas7/Cse4/CasC n=1 Tax=Streptomyces sp. (strain SPB074) TaxID=465543 RepID=UPI00017F0E40|nr:type I-E CRISPR-associated protein Cas7/Cse4/CasC [Streptomyces sp. SPB074]EDY43246.2 cse4 family CRISPR-associated protein [Streptomyces sp. SPB074]